MPFFPMLLKIMLQNAVGIAAQKLVTVAWEKFKNSNKPKPEAKNE